MIHKTLLFSLIFLCFLADAADHKAQDASNVPAEENLPAVVVIRGQTRKGAPSQQDMNKQTSIILKILSEAGVKATDVKDNALSDKSFQGAKIAILPYNGELTEDNFKPLKQFVDNGGKIMTFFSSDPKLSEILGLKPPKFIPGTQFGKALDIRFDTKSLPGLPQKMRQTSWNVIDLKPIDKKTTVIGKYLDADGKEIPYAAVTKNKNGFAFAHILQRQNAADTDAAILSCIATAYPDIWKEAADSTFTQIGVIGGCENFDQLFKMLMALPRGAHSHSIVQAQKKLENARSDYQQKKYHEAFTNAVEANKLSRKAFLLSIKPRDGELRGAWIHSAYGIADWGWDKTIRVLKENGFNAIFANMLWGYVADYESDVLPVHPNVAEKGDQIKLCLEACRKYGVQLHIWKVCWNMGHRTPPELCKKMQDAGRTQVTFSGEKSQFLAPHLKENFDLEVNAFLEIVRKYNVDGIHFDYIRYPESNCDYSQSAREAFEKVSGIHVPKWPDDVNFGGKYRKQYNAWRCSNIDRLVATVSRLAHKIRPDIKVSAAVYGSWDSVPDALGQSPEKWLANGWLDFICPMDYTADRNYFRRLVQRQIEGNTKHIPLYIGIGSYIHRDAPNVAEQIHMTRELGADGFICFCHDAHFSKDILPELKQGPTAAFAQPPFPHQAPDVKFTFSKTSTPKLEGAYAFPEPVTVTAEFPADFTFTPNSAVRLLKNGYYLTTQPKISIKRIGNTLHCTFLAPEPGLYRLDISDSLTFLVRSQTLPLLSPEEVRSKLIADGLPQFANNGRPKIAVWQDEAYGVPAIMEALRINGSFDVAPLMNLKPESLAVCHAVIIPQPRNRAFMFKREETAATLHNYVKNGGSLLVTHALAGLGNYPIICPEIIANIPSSALKTNLWKTVSTHPITKDIPKSAQKSSFVDLIPMTPGPKGQVVATDAENKRPVVIAGSCGQGRFIAVGHGLAIGRGDVDTELTPSEKTLLINAVKWLTKQK